MNIIAPLSPSRPRVDDALRALIANRVPGHSLTRRSTQPAGLRPGHGGDLRPPLIHVAVEPDIPEPGDYITVDVGRHSVVIVRDDDQQIRAFHNVCRHRGSRLCQEQQGSVGNLVCPYHQWTYTLDGKLAYAEHMGAGFDSARTDSSPCMQSLAGLLFICLADTPPTDFARLRDEVEPYLLPHHLNDCKIAAQIDIIEEGNWKLTMENNRECYHCAANHPELTISLFEYGFGYQPSAANAQQLADFDALSQRLESEWQADGLPSSELDCLDERITGYRVRRLPLDRAGESETLDGRVASRKLLGNFQRADLGGLSFWTQPNAWFHFMSDHIVTFSVLPIAPEKPWCAPPGWCTRMRANTRTTTSRI